MKSASAQFSAGKLSTVKKAIFSERGWQTSLITCGISSGEMCGYIFVFQSTQRSMTRCYKLQVPGLWKSRRSPTKLNQIMSTVLQAAHKQEAHHCHPVTNSSGHQSLVFQRRHGVHVILRVQESQTQLDQLFVAWKISTKCHYQSVRECVFHCVNGAFKLTF